MQLNSARSVVLIHQSFSPVHTSAARAAAHACPVNIISAKRLRQNDRHADARHWPPSDLHKSRGRPGLSHDQPTPEPFEVSGLSIQIKLWTTATDGVISLPVSVTLWTTQEPIKLLQLSIQNNIRTTATCWLGHQSCKDLLIQDHFSLWTVLQRLARTRSLQSLNSSTNWGVWLVHANLAMDKCHLLIVSSVFQWAVLFEQQDQSGCCSCPFKTRYGQLHQSSCCSCPFKTRYGQLRRWLGHQCCKDLLTQDHLSLWTVGTNWGVWLVHSNQAMDNCHLLIGSSVLQKLAHTGSLQFLNNSSNWLVSIVQSNQAMDKRNLLTGLWFLQWLPHRQVMFACCSL